MVEPNWMGGLAGGIMIGAAAVLLLAINGRIAGISGIVGGLIVPTAARDVGWRIAFVAGLIGGAGLYALYRGSFPLHLQATPPIMIVAGLLVGFGTRLGSGCTSGHGVCGLARRSPRSFTATLLFISAAILTVFVTRHLLP